MQEKHQKECQPDRQEDSARDFGARQGLEAQEYFVYFKLSNCGIAPKDPPKPADDPASAPHNYWKNCAWTARMARSESSLSMRTESLISLVEIMWMLMCAA